MENTLVVKFNNNKTKTFKDIIDYNLEILFVGLNPSPISIERKHYHQGKLGKRFWKRLKQYKILNGAKEGKEDESLLKNSFGITDLVKRPSPNSSALTKKEYFKGRKELRNKVMKYKPKIICFIYKKAVEKFLVRKIDGSGKIDIKIGDSFIFILPSMFAKKREVQDKMKELKKLLLNI